MVKRLTDLGFKYFTPSNRMALLSATNLLLGTVLTPYLGNGFLGKLHSSTTVFSLIHLAGIYYGILNDAFAVQYSVKYFAEGHNPGQNFMTTYDKSTNTFVWGHIATSGLAILAGLVYGAADFAMNLANLPQQKYLAPIVFGAATAIAVGIEGKVYYNYLHAKYARGADAEIAPWNWESCNFRNTMGYMALPTLGAVGLVAYAATRIAGYTPELNINPKVTIGVQVASLLFLALGNLYVNSEHKGETVKAYIGESGWAKG